MAKVTVCDRCGKKCGLTTTRKFSFGKVFLQAWLYEEGGYKTSHDLCHDCALELDKFFEGKATDAVVKE